MKSQLNDLSYGDKRERVNHPRIEELLGVRLQKLDKYHCMDWKEIQSDDEAPWWVEQKARNISFTHCEKFFSFNGRPTVLIGKHKLDYIKTHGGNGVIFFDFTDKLKYWVFNEEELKGFDVEGEFLRGERTDVIDKPCAVVHIPLANLHDA